MSPPDGLHTPIHGFAMIAILSAVLLTGCTDKPEINLLITDIWGKPIPEASVVQWGVEGMQKTDGGGRLMLQVAEPGEVKLQAGTSGYIKDFLTVQVTGDSSDPVSATIRLYPAPEEPGFYGVGDRGYQRLESTPVEQVDTEISRYHGIRDISRSALHRRGEAHTFVYFAILRDWEIRRLGLELTQLRFEESTEVTGLLGPMEIDLNMWVADGEVETDIDGLWAIDNYLITTKGQLEPGAYAFQAQSILNSRSADALNQLPEELRVVYPFEVK